MKKDIPNRGETGFDEWVAELIAHDLTDKEILTYLEHDTREEHLVALVRLIMQREPVTSDNLREAAKGVTCTACGRTFKHDFGDWSRHVCYPCRASETYDSYKDTRLHIGRVRELLGQVQAVLDRRGVLHDDSKLRAPEKPVFDEFTPKLKGTTYGSEEYKGFLAAMKPALDYHYAVSRHHPEHFEAGVNSMNLIDLIEMLADWKAASERHDDGNLYRSFQINADRFGMSGWLKDCLLHTAVDLGWWDGVIPKERIKAAAIELKDGRVFTGECHESIIQSSQGKAEREATIGSRDGFVTTEGRFVDREEARNIAVAAGQVPEGIGVLYSEDLMTFDENYFKE